MPGAAIATIRSGLDTQLSAVTQLKDVVIGRTQKFAAFPASRHYLVGVTDKDETTSENYRSYQFGLDIVHCLSIEGVTIETAEGEFQDAVDAVLDKLNNQWQLGGIEHSIIQQGTVTYTEGAQGVMVTMSLVWQARVLISI